MLDRETLYIVEEYIKEYKPAISKQLEAERYYNNEIEAEMKHDFFGLLVDEKINYLLGKEPTIECKNKAYVDAAKKILGSEFLYDMQEVAREASIKSIAWMQFYITEDGKAALMTIPSEEIIPVWTDKRHRSLDMLIRRYPITYYEGITKKEMFKVEIYNKYNVYYYEEVDGVLRVDSQKYLDMDDDVDYGHFNINGQQYSMERIPFVWCKNNAKEKSDLVKVKDLIDKYNSSRSRLDEILDDFKNFLVNVRNYAGNTENNNNLKTMIKNRIIYTDGEGGVEILTPNIDTSANDSHNQSLKDDIILFGQSVDRNKMTTGGAISGVALKTLYSGLDLKCNGLESELNIMFDNLQYFIKQYLRLVGIKVSEEDDIDIVFNRDISINEEEAINMCKNSVGVISNRTIIANHPWVTDLEEEIKNKEEEDNHDLDYAIRTVQEDGEDNDDN